MNNEQLPQQGIPEASEGSDSFKPIESISELSPEIGSTFDVMTADGNRISESGKILGIFQDDQNGGPGYLDMEFLRAGEEDKRRGKLPLDKIIEFYNDERIANFVNPEKIEKEVSLEEKLAGFLPTGDIEKDAQEFFRLTGREVVAEDRDNVIHQLTEIREAKKKILEIVKSTRARNENQLEVDTIDGIIEMAMNGKVFASSEKSEFREKTGKQEQLISDLPKALPEKSVELTILPKGLFEGGNALDENLTSYVQELVQRKGEQGVREVLGALSSNSKYTMEKYRLQKAAQDGNLDNFIESMEDMFEDTEYANALADSFRLQHEIDVKQRLGLPISLDEKNRSKKADSRVWQQVREREAIKDRHSADSKRREFEARTREILKRLRDEEDGLET